jgi:adenosylmethionine-8-amino-7-oxononanoate aminotransferase
MTDLQEAAKRHLWMHFTRMSSYADHEIPVIERGEGAYVWDSHGKRYLDGLSGLFVVQAGHGRQELADAAGKQAAQLGYFPIWSYAHPTAIELAERLASYAPGDINRVFFTTGGSEAVESAWKLARQYFKVIGQPMRHKVISRDIAYHGTTMGALSINGVASIRSAFEPLVPGAIHVPNTNFYRAPEHGDDEERFGVWAAAEIERALLREDPETVAAVFLEPVQNSGGCFTPPAGYFDRVREICDRYGVLLVSDEVICAFGRLGYWFGSERYGYQPDIITVAKGMTSGYALANLDVFERDGLLAHVRTNAPAFRATIEKLCDLPIVGDVRGDGYFLALELVKDKATKETFTDEEGEDLLRGFLSAAMFDAGLICRADDRGDPVIQLSPPLICEQQQFDEIEQILRSVLTEAWSRLSGGELHGERRSTPRRQPGW